MTDKKLVVVISATSGAGKTTYSAALNAPVIHFDKIHDYDKNITYYARLQNFLTVNANAPVVVMDAWMLSLDAGMARLKEIAASRQLEVHCLYTTHMERYCAQLDHQRKKHYTIPLERASYRKHSEYHGDLSQSFLTSLMDVVRSGTPVRWFFRHDGRYVEYPNDIHCRSILGADPIVQLLSWIDCHSFDPRYQTIELDGEVLCVGYTNSAESWRRIQQWGIDWNGKTVGEMGCYLGYFCFKVEEAGAKQVVGYDASASVLVAAKKLAELRRSTCQFTHCNLSIEPIVDNFDLCLVLNVLHHIGPQVDGTIFQSFLDQVFRHSRQVIFEIERDSEQAVRRIAQESGFTVAHEADSHRVTGKGIRKLLHFMAR